MGCIQLGAASARLDLRRFERRDGEVLLRADVLGHRLIDVSRARLVRAGTSGYPAPVATGCWTRWIPGGARAAVRPARPPGAPT